MVRLRSLLSSVIVAGVAGMALAVPAAASPDQDYVYYSSLENSGFHISDPPLARAQGQGVCLGLLNDRPWKLIITGLMNFGYDLDESAMIMASGVSAYCPDMQSSIMGPNQKI